MAQADTLVSLVKAASVGDKALIKKHAEALIQEERRIGHGIFADRLEKALFTQHNRYGSFSNSEFNGGRLVGNSVAIRDLVKEVTPERALRSLVLSESIQCQLREVIEEQHRADLLRAFGLSPRNRLLFIGAPGNGKTSVAEALAYEMMTPLLVVRYECLIGSYLGETSSRLQAVLDYAKTRHCVLFLDEFDTLGKERGDTHETGEIKRVVSSLLLQLDELPDYVVVVAASNHPELLDRAVWRRFQVRVDFPMPNREHLKVFIESFAKKNKINFGVSASSLANKLNGMSFSEAEEFCLSVARRAVLDRCNDNARDIVRMKLLQLGSQVNARE